MFNFYNSVSLQQIFEMLTKLLDTASYLKAKIKGDELQIALNQATNDDNWQASTTVLHEISRSAYNHEKWKKIHDFLWDKLKNNKNWRKILKALNIVQFLIKNGPSFAVNQLKQQVNFFATLTSYHEIENGSDRGASIRERAKVILGLLQNDELLQDERLRAKQIRQKMSLFTGCWNSEEGRKAGIEIKYGSFDSKTFQKNEQSAESRTYYNYGSGNYGDREQDAKYNHSYFQNLNRFKNQQDKPKSNPQISQNQEFTKSAQKIIKQQSPNKNKYDSLAKKLSKTTIKNQGGIVKPDLSYKKQQQPEQNLIDVQAYFVQTKYHLHQHEQQPTSALQKTAESKPITKQEQITISKQPNLLNQLQDLSFVGLATQQKQTQPSISLQNKANQNKPEVIPTLSVFPHPPSTNHAPIINYSLTYNQIGPIQPTYNHPYGLNSNYPAYSYNSNPYQQIPIVNPYAGLSNYQQPSYPQYNQNYPAGYGNPYQSTQQKYDPNSFAGVSINLKSDLIQQKKDKPEASNKRIDEQNLTDLSGLVQQIGKQAKNKQLQKPKAKAGINNNLKIDPWVW